MSEIVANDAIVEWKKKRRRKWIIRTVIVLALCGAGAVVYWQWPEKEVAAVPQNETLKVERGDVTETLDATGTVKASKEVNLNFTGESTDKLAAVNVAPGDRVKAGQVLARLDDTEARNQAQSAADDLAMAKNKLEEALKGPKPEEVEIQQVNVQRAKTELERAKQNFDIEEAQSQKEQSSKQLEQARKAYDDQKFLLEEGAVPANEMEQAEQALEKAEQDYKAQERNMRKIENQQKQAIEDAEISYRQALAELKKIQTPADDSAIEAAKIDVRRAETVLKQKQDSLTKLEIKAPWDGVILKVNGDVGTSPTAPFIVMNNASANNLMIAAKIGQSDIVKVQTGLKAVFRTNAYPGEEFQGEVKFVSPEPSTEDGSTAYPIELSVKNPDGKLKTGMVMEISILLGTHKDVLFVPAMAIRSEGGQDGVYVASNPAAPEAYEFVPVEQGFYTPDRVELKSGVKEGDTVVIPAPAVMPEDPMMGGAG
ncbi:efflux RND transporter periplasmic adaptor subunit [Paenibacillus terreus]|uniref:Efflux RND transporter periplasmic adaptor subunit n=1 Tax=Paenibacillus terreus TaxID=1387834 RepID=A0ABV5B119_9BACL